MLNKTFNTHTIEFYRKGAKTLAEGEYIRTPDKYIGKVKGSLQPLAQGSRYGKDKKLTPEGAYSSAEKLFLSKQVLRVASQQTGEESDYCKLEDGVYEITGVSDWGVKGFSTFHYLYVLTRRPSKSGDFVI